MKHTKKHISCLIMIILIIAFDQITKYFASLKLADGSVAKFIPGVVQFKYAENTGMAFSMLSGARWVFIALTVVVCRRFLLFVFKQVQKPVALLEPRRDFVGRYRQSYRPYKIWLCC